MWTNFLSQRALPRAAATVTSRPFSNTTSGPTTSTHCRIQHTSGTRNGVLLAATAATAATAGAFAYHEHSENTTLSYASQATTIAACDGQTDDEHTPKEKAARLFRKKTTIQVANASPEQDIAKRKSGLLQRFSTQQELDKLRAHEKEMLQRWERDEEGWRDLPARAWPAYQPNPGQLKGILAEITTNDCHRLMLEKAKENESDDNTNLSIDKNENDLDMTKLCTQLLFDMATAYVFYSVDPQAGLAQYEQLAKMGHVDSMVACGIILMEGLGVPPNEKAGLEWLEKAVQYHSAQAYYELGTVYYTGGVVEEDVDKAFQLFELAAEQDHTAATYMVADCLVEGEGTEKSVARAIPLFYKAAERGHRFSRQRIRELLARIEYPV